MVDPLVDQTGQAYAYGNGNPIDNIDPLGLDSWLDDTWNTISPGGSNNPIRRWAAGGLTAARAVLGLNPTLPAVGHFFTAASDCSTSGSLNDIAAGLDWMILGFAAPEVDETELGIDGGADILRSTEAAQRGTRAPEAFFDATGKVHGQLPNPADLGEYDPETLATLRDELERSVQTRIAKTVELGSDYGHSARIAEEQSLIRSINKYLADRPVGPR
jgi:hypothetical protein